MSELFYQGDYWQKMPQREHNFVAADLHPSWSQEKQEYLEHTEIPQYVLDLTQKNSVLDFGIGMGRNYNYLKENFKEVYGFDTIGMIENLKEFRPEIKTLTSNWNVLLQKKYDLIYEITVFQHMPPQEFLHKLFYLSFISPYYFSVTRCYNDFLRNYEKSLGGINMMKLIESLNCFELINCSSNDFGSMDETHYSVLWKSKNYV